MIKMLLAFIGAGKSDTPIVPGDDHDIVDLDYIQDRIGDISPPT